MTIDQDAKFGPLLKKLRRVIGKLDGTTDRPIARRNARKRVLTALRAIRATLDREYPAIIKRAGYTKLTPKGRINRLERAGWVNVTDEEAATYAAAGVSVRRVAWVEEKAFGYPKQIVETKHDMVFVPGWATAIGLDKPTQLRAAKKSIKAKRVALVTAGLKRT